MSYTDESGKVISIHEMTYVQEREFREHFRSFGFQDADDNKNLGELFDGILPSLERIKQNIDDSDMFEEADEDTINAASEEYSRGWQEWCESLDEASFSIRHRID